MRLAGPRVVPEADVTGYGAAPHVDHHIGPLGTSGISDILSVTWGGEKGATLQGAPGAAVSRGPATAPPRTLKTTEAYQFRIVFPGRRLVFLAPLRCL